MKKAWCDICGKEFPNASDVEIGEIRMRSPVQDDFAFEPINKKLDVCRGCLTIMIGAADAYTKLFNENKEEK